MATIQERNLQASFEKIYAKQNHSKMDTNTSGGILKDDIDISTIGFSKKGLMERSPHKLKRGLPNSDDEITMTSTKPDGDQIIFKKTRSKGMDIEDSRKVHFKDGFPIGFSKSKGKNKGIVVPQVCQKTKNLIKNIK